MHEALPRRVVSDDGVLTHLMVDMYGINPDTLNDSRAIGAVLTGAATAGHLHPLAEPQAYRYPGQGLTVFLPIRESHFAIHTYPEYGYASADVVSCGRMAQARRAADFMVERLAADRVDSRLVRRGFLNPDEPAARSAPAERPG